MLPSDRQFEPQEEPELTDLVRILRRAIELGINVALPGVIESFTPAVPSSPAGPGKPAIARVRPSVLAIHKGPDGKTEVPMPRPAIPAAVFGFRAGGGFKETWQPLPGDFGWLFASDRSLEKWRTAGGAPVDPTFSHTHSYTDAIFLPCGKPGPLGTTIGESGRYAITTDTGSPVEPGSWSMDTAGNTVIEGPTIRLGRLAGLPIARMTDGVMPSAAFLLWIAQVQAWITAAHALPIIGPILAALPIPVLPPIPFVPVTSEGFATILPTVPSVKNTAE